MEVKTTALAGVLIVAPKVFADARGFFLESFNQRQFDAAVGAPVSFVQDNHSRSAQGVLRGLHMQVGAHAQGKLVRVTSGRIFDVAVDVRAGSPTYRQWVGVELDDVAHRQLWVPPGLAHGFLVMSESADVQYKTTDYYAPAAELGSAASRVGATRSLAESAYGTPRSGQAIASAGSSQRMPTSAAGA